MWQDIYDTINYPLYRDGSFIFSAVNVIIISAIVAAGLFLIRILKKYSRAIKLSQRQLQNEGREVAIWKLTQQSIYFLIFVSCYYSLLINNQWIDYEAIFDFEFIRFEKFHIALYHFFLIAIFFFIARLVLGIVKVVLLKTVRSTNSLDRGTEYVYIQIIKYIIYCITVVFSMRSMGVDMDLFLTSTAFLLVGLGLGLQDIFKDFFSGFILLFESKVKVGDVIEIDNMKQSQDNFVARIIEINLRTSRVRTIDGKSLIVPNSKLTHERVNNWSHGDSLTRFMIPVTVKFGSDTEKVKELLIQCAHEHPKVSTRKQATVRLLKFGENGLEMDLVFWAEQNFAIDMVKSDIRFAIDKIFRENNIQYPYPQMDVHLDK